MKRLRKILISILVLTSLPVVGFAQNSGSSPLQNSALTYLYQPNRRWTGSKFLETKPSLTDRISLSLESGGYQMWRYNSPLDAENWGTRHSINLGYQLSPVHNIEIGAGWNQSALYNGHLTAGVSYLFNFTAYASQRETPSRWELFLSAGSDVEFTEQTSVVVNSGVRVKYNISPTVGLYLEPNISMVAAGRYPTQYRTRDVRSSIQFGITMNPYRVINSINAEFALKTNLLYDAATIANVELEIPIKERFSVAGEWIFPWWTNDNGRADSKRNRTQLLNANIEGKYWFGNRTLRPTMTGWFAGYYIGGGLYDFERKGKGYQGDFYVATGLSAGYAHTINKSGSLRMEYSLGAGYMITDYAQYKADFGNDDTWHAVIAEQGKFYWLGPTKAKVSLVWYINQKRDK